MKKIIISSLAIASFLSISSCNTDFDTDVADIATTSGEADFTTYVALGNSLTSGYRDGALYTDGQLESYPAIIASQMQKAGGGEFVQPLVSDNNGGLLAGGYQVQEPKLYIKEFTNGQPIIERVAKKPTTEAGQRLKGKFNNMGVPGAKSFHLALNGFGSTNFLNMAFGAIINPYFTRFASSDTTSILEDALAQNPTFYSLWIGNNDVLGFATSGGVGKDRTGNVNTNSYSSNDISDPQVVADSIEKILKAMKDKGAKGVIANIPDVTSIPLFTTIPYNAVPLTEAQAKEMNVLLSKAKAILTALGQGDRIVLAKAGQNPLLIKDKTLTDLSGQIISALQNNGFSLAQATIIGKVFGQARHTTTGDYVLLTTKSVIGTSPKNAIPNFDKYGITYPLEDEHILTKSEVALINTAIAAYNTKIKALAETYGLAFVDTNAKMVELSKNSGISYNGVNYTIHFATGGTFSLDGVHLTGKGAAIIANEFIKAINTKYKSTLPQVNPNKYSGISFP